MRADISSCFLLESGELTYPEAAKKANIEGWMVVQYGINLEGRVCNLKVVDADPELMFERVVLEYRKQAKGLIKPNRTHIRQERVVYMRPAQCILLEAISFEGWWGVISCSADNYDGRSGGFMPRPALVEDQALEVVSEVDQSDRGDTRREARWCARTAPYNASGL